MLGAGLRRNSAGRPHTQAVNRFHPALLLALTALLINTYSVATEINTAYEAVTYTAGTVQSLLLLIELGLLAGVTGAWLRRSPGAFISLAGLSLVGVGYTLWYAYSLQTLEYLTSKPFYRSYPEAMPPHLFYLVGAAWLNFVVLLVSGVLAVLEVKRLRAAHETLR